MEPELISVYSTKQNHGSMYNNDQNVSCDIDLPLSDCSSGQLVSGGGSATKNGNSRSRFGCSNSCPTTGPETHVLAQVGARDSHVINQISYYFCCFFI